MVRQCSVLCEHHGSGDRGACNWSCGEYALPAAGAACMRVPLSSTFHIISTNLRNFWIRCERFPFLSLSRCIVVQLGLCAGTAPECFWLLLILLLFKGCSLSSIIRMKFIFRVLTKINLGAASADWAGAAAVQAWKKSGLSPLEPSRCPHQDAGPMSDTRTMCFGTCRDNDHVFFAMLCRMTCTWRSKMNFLVVAEITQLCCL